jgi:hypothetical protein
MKKRKLALNKQTLKHLRMRDMKEGVGGFPPTSEQQNPFCPGGPIEPVQPRETKWYQGCFNF